MPAPKGNQYALGHHFGRPRKYDLKEEAKRMIEWADQEDVLILREWECLRDYAEKMMYEYADMDEDFKHALNYARKRIGIRREQFALKNKINHSVYHRTAGMYDKELKQYDKEMKESSAPQVANVAIETINYGDTPKEASNSL